MCQLENQHRVLKLQTKNLKVMQYADVLWCYAKKPKMCELMSAFKLIFADILEMAQLNKVVELF